MSATFDPTTLPLPDGLPASLLPAVLARHGDMLTVKDARTGRYLYASQALEALLGAQLTDRTDADSFDAAVNTALRAAEQTALAQGEPLLSDHRFDHHGQRLDFSVLRLVVPEGEQRWLCSVWADQRPARQREQQLRTALEQIEQQQRANDLLRRELADQALRDPASGLYTRAHFEDQLRREVDLSSREHREFALVFIEIDPPTAVVQALGAAGAARIHEAMGRLLRGGTRAMDTSCRQDDRHFAVLLSGVGLATAHSRMEGLRRQCATQIVVHDGRELGFTVSMGVASYPHTAHSEEELLQACSTALSEASRRGGNHVTLAAIRFEPR